MISEQKFPGTFLHCKKRLVLPKLLVNGGIDINPVPVDIFDVVLTNRVRKGCYRCTDRCGVWRKNWCTISEALRRRRTLPGCGVPSRLRRRIPLKAFGPK